MDTRVPNVVETTDLNIASDVMQEDRFGMPTAAVLAFRQAALKAAAHLLEELNSEDFKNQPLRDRLKVIDLVLDRAYGKAETNTARVASDQTADKDQVNTHSSQIATITRRMRERGENLPELVKGARPGEVNTAAPTVILPTGERGRGGDGYTTGMAGRRQTPTSIRDDATDVDSDDLPLGKVVKLRSTSRV